MLAAAQERVGKKKDAARKISADHLYKTNGEGGGDPANYSSPKKNKDFMLVFQLNMLQKLFILYSRTKLLQPHTFSVCCNVKKHELCIVLVCFLAKIINK